MRLVASGFAKPIILSGDASYWAVSVVKKMTRDISFTEAGLRGKTACHTGYMKSAGWVMPMGKMKDLGRLA